MGSRQDVLQGREDMLLRLVRHGPVHGPSGRDIRDREGETVLAGIVGTVVGDLIGLDETRHRIVPLGPGAEWELGLQQRGSDPGTSAP
jgi:hypothetical protein